MQGMRARTREDFRSLISMAARCSFHKKRREFLLKTKCMEKVFSIFALSMILLEL